MGEDMNPDRGISVPIGRSHKTVRTSSMTTPTPAPKGDPPGINFHQNASVGINSSSVNEPSGAVGKDVIFVTFNWLAAYSTNNGGSFTQLDPTTIFPNGADGGFCCDQVVQYCPSIDRIVWLMQFSTAVDAQGNMRNRYRLASASPADIKNSHGTAWTYWDFTTGQVGIANGWLDYPDLSVGTNSLYLNYDWVGVGRATIRMPLAEIAASATIHWWYTDPNLGGVAYGGHLTQDCGDEIFWAGHNSNSNMRVFSWKENSNTYFWRDVNVGSWNNGAIASSSPDGQDWCTKLNNFPGHAVTGSVRVHPGSQSDRIWFAWTASSGSNFRQAQVQWVAMDRNNNFNVTNQAQIWNDAYAFAYPALGANAKNEIGLSLEYGGPNDWENHVVGFWGDFLVYITTSTDVGTTRFGDYVSIRKDSQNPERFDAFGYGLNKPGAKSDTHYVQFGR